MKHISSRNLSLYLLSGVIFISLILLFSFFIVPESLYFISDIIALPLMMRCKIAPSFYCSEDHSITVLIISYLPIAIFLGIIVLKIRGYNIKRIHKKVIGVLAVLSILILFIIQPFWRSTEFCVLFNSGPRPCIKLTSAQTEELIEKIDSLPNSNTVVKRDSNTGYQGVLWEGSSSYRGVTGSFPFESLDKADRSFLPEAIARRFLLYYSQDMGSKSSIYVEIGKGLVMYYSSNKVSNSSMQYIGKLNPNYLYKKDENREVEMWLVGLMNLDGKLKKTFDTHLTGTEFEGKYVSASIPNGYEFVEITESSNDEEKAIVTSLSMGVENYVGLLGFAIKKNDETIFSMNGVEGIGGTTLCSVVPLFDDTPNTYYGAVVKQNNTNFEDVTTELKKITGEYSHIYLLGMYFRRVGTVLYQNDDSYVKVLDKQMISSGYSEFFYPKCDDLASIFYLKEVGYKYLGTEESSQSSDEFRSLNGSPYTYSFYEDGEGVTRSSEDLEAIDYILESISIRQTTSK